MKREIREPKQKRSIEKKNKIIAAAYKIFNDKGYYNTNTAEIAKEAGLSTGCLYDYFIDKQDIFISVLAMHNTQIKEMIFLGLNAIPDDVSLLEFMKAFIQIFIDSHNHSKGFHQEVMALSYTNKDIEKYLFSYENERSIEFFSDYLEKRGAKLHNKQNQVILMLNTIDNLCHELLFKEHELINEEEYISECAYMLIAMLTH